MALNADASTFPMFMEGKIEDEKGFPSTSTDRKACRSCEFFNVGFISNRCRNISNSNLEVKESDRWI